jgi:hypothetical protein
VQDEIEQEEEPLMKELSLTDIDEMAGAEEWIFFL